MIIFLLEVLVKHISISKYLPYVRALCLFGVVFGVFFTDAALAQSQGGQTQGVGAIATGITTQFKALGQLILAVAFLAGIGFIMAAIFKFKQHKDNPTQIPLGTPIAMLVIGAFLVFLPSLIAPVGQTLFGSVGTPKAGGFTGSGVSIIPGASS
jgi:intracellular multiplication protein IcmD